MKKILYTLLIIIAVSTTSCDSWLDVTPKTDIKASENFSTEQGYKDALTGVYLLLTSESLYGRELTFGMLDAMAQYYTAINTSNVYNYAAAFDYSNASIESSINGIWSNMYKAIANNNELIKQLDKADPVTFTGRNYHLMRGEAYGLRAMLHFDLVRLWGKSYAADPEDKCIPYMTNVTADVTPLSTVKEALAKVLADLAVAEQELAYDPVNTGALSVAGATNDATFERDRTFKFNYYAVKMLEARVNLYMKNYADALAAAKEVVGQHVFYWTPEGEITTAQTAQRNRVFSEELVFCLYDSNLRSRYSSYFSAANVQSLIMSEGCYEAVYELFNAGFSGDYRYAYQNEELDGHHYSTKLQQPASGSNSYSLRMPMMRLSEAYYIAAECELKLNSDIAAALGYINTVRLNRNLVDELSATMSADAAMDEIRKEYTKEFMCEGQLYYFFKRLNYAAIPVYSSEGGHIEATYVEPNYKFPLPDDEIEYGGRNNE